jgi:hypothetical protein
VSLDMRRPWVVIGATSRGSGSAFMVRSSAGFFANYPVPGGGRTQHLLGVLEPSRPEALVLVDPVDLELVNFHRAQVTKA